MHMTMSRQYKNLNNSNSLKFLSLSRKISFTDEMQTYLSSEISLLESLNSIGKHSQDIVIKDICKNLKKAIESGLTFAQSITKYYEKAFGKTYISIIRAGEDSGELDSAMKRLLALLKKQDTIKRKVISASTHPAITFFLLFLIMIVYSKFVFPKFYEHISDSIDILPTTTKVLIAAANFIGNFWWLIILLFVAAIFGAVWLFKIPKAKMVFDNIILKIPFVKEFIKYINLSNFMAVLHVSYESGLPLTNGIELACETIGNHTMKAKINKSVILLKQGKTLSESLNSTGVVPNITISTIAAGEESGSLGKKFLDATNVLDKKVDTALETLTKLLEPTLILVLGVVIAFVAIACIQAYFEINFAIL